MFHMAQGVFYKQEDTVKLFTLLMSAACHLHPIANCGCSHKNFK